MIVKWGSPPKFHGDPDILTGQDRHLTAALLNKLELGELREDAPFRSSLAQEKRGERGELARGVLNRTSMSG